jgi:hypothetical protein
LCFENEEPKGSLHFVGWILRRLGENFQATANHAGITIEEYEYQHKHKHSTTMFDANLYSSGPKFGRSTGSLAEWFTQVIKTQPDDIYSGFG